MHNSYLMMIIIFKYFFIFHYIRIVIRKGLVYNICLISNTFCVQKSSQSNTGTNCEYQIVKYGKQSDGYVNYVKGANIAGFMKVAKAMMAQGIL